MQIKLDLKHVQYIHQIVCVLPVSSKSDIYICKFWLKDTIKHECVISRNISHIYLRYIKNKNVSGFTV